MLGLWYVSLPGSLWVCGCLYIPPSISVPVSLSQVWWYLSVKSVCFVFPNLSPPLFYPSDSSSLTDSFIRYRGHGWAAHHSFFSGYHWEPWLLFFSGHHNVVFFFFFYHAQEFSFLYVFTLAWRLGKVAVLPSKTIQMAFFLLVPRHLPVPRYPFLSSSI